ncbi:hypothetical protein [Chlorobium sp. KB01]|uniref:hypothetical protein n=1 Tax=Chlorobium sp. KB01 TaxID=1917528 RepID=UPI0009765DB4|nr:hypothetical protein [Chlorobium sp. KB01]
MKIVLQCAGRKNPQLAGSGFRTNDGRLVKFIANLGGAPINDQYIYARPDDLSDCQYSWRERLMEINKDAESNPLRLLPAFRLYKPKVYENLVNKFGVKQVYILSAGWGLIASDFLTPDYDITFSNARNVPPYSHRRKSDRYDDFCQIPDDGDTLVFIGGKDYLPLFCKLTKELKGQKKVFFNSDAAPEIGNGFCSERFITTQKTNWQYSCAQALIDGSIIL